MILVFPLSPSPNPIDKPESEVPITKSLVLSFALGKPSEGRVKCLYIEKDKNPSSMDGVPDLRDQKN